MLVEISKLAAKQAGVVSRSQLFALGLTRHAIQYLLNRELLIRQQFRGVYRLPSTVVTRGTHLWAALLWGGEGAVLSHVTAGWVWKLEGLGRQPPDVIDISVPHETQIAPKKTVHAWRVRTMEHVKDWGIVHGFPCTNLSRTLIDLAAVLDEGELEHAYDSAMRRSRENRAALFSALRRLGATGRRGIDNLIEIAMRDELGPTQSWLEDETRQVMRAAGIRTPLPQYEIRDAQQRLICRPDFTWPEVEVALFCDSWEHHGKRARFELDPVQRNRLIAIGWRPLVVTHRRLITDEAGFLQELRDTLSGSG